MFNIGENFHVNLYPALILTIIISIISFVIQQKQLTSVYDSFKNGKYDEKLIKKCKKLKKYYRFAANKDTYNTLCCILGDVALNNNDLEQFFIEINSAKEISLKTYRDFALVFIVYFRKGRYADLFKEYAEFEISEKSLVATLKRILVKYDIFNRYDDKTEILLNRIENQHVYECLNILMSFKTGDEIGSSKTG